MDKDNAWSEPATIPPAVETPAGARDVPEASAASARGVPEASSAEPKPIVVHSQAEDEQQPIPGRRRPGICGTLLRFFQLVAAVGAIGFVAGAKSYSGNKGPFQNMSQSPIDGFYIVGGIAGVVAFVFFIQYIISCFRKQSNPKWLLFFLDLLICAAWIIITLYLLSNYHCPIGGNNGWCNFFNTGMFFGVLSFMLWGLSCFCDVCESCYERCCR